MRISEAEKQRLARYIKDAEEARFSGWDFSWTDQFGGKAELPFPWDYRKTVISYKDHVDSMLDMGTGGGEFLSGLQPLPVITAATESWEPNVLSAKNRLEPLGVEVVPTFPDTQASRDLPFPHDAFDLIINRHDDFEAREVFRVLKPEGVFITQQVGYRDLQNLRLCFSTLADAGDTCQWDLNTAAELLAEGGFSIVSRQESISYTRFYDIRTLVFYLKALAWLFPDYNSKLYYQRLENIYLLIRRDGFFDDICHRFFITAVKRTGVSL